MLKRTATEFIRLGAEFSDWETVYHLTQAEGPDEPGRVLHPGEKKDLERHLREVVGICLALDLPLSAELIKPYCTDLPQTKREYEILKMAVLTEIKDKPFLFVPPHLAKYYEWNEIVSDEGIKAFPRAYEEIRNSGICLACGLNTASVFHAMRAAEIAVRVFGAELGASFPIPLEQVEWYNILDQINSKIAAIGKDLPKGKEKNDRLQFYSEAAAQLRYFKDGWRIHVAHARATYDESQAITALDHVRELLEVMKDHIIGEMIL